MKIGFFDTQIESILFFKEMVSMFPNNDFYYYADTQTGAYAQISEEDVDDALRTAGQYFAEREVGCICVSSHIPKDRFELIMQDISPSCSVISFDMFESYAIENDLGQTVAEGQIRSINLTEHSPTTNEKIALLLGGHFIEE